LILTLFVGAKFIYWVYQLENGSIPAVSRPPGVEAFLPISALISLKYWILTGIFNAIHPSALVLLLIFLGTSLLLKKGFCSWICPFGLLSEMLLKVHRFLFKGVYYVWRWVDYPLRSLKYLILLFFVWAVFVQMNVADLHSFIYGPYNKVADIKMLKFFSTMTSTTFWVLLALVVLSIIVPFFWCRYLCPYGALVGGLSWLSPFKVRRNKKTCIDCKECTMACPVNIKVHNSRSVISDECHACLQCVDACPVNDTLYLSFTKQSFKLPRTVYATAIVLIFTLGVFTASVTGHWKNNIPVEEYQYHIQHLNDPQYQHNRGQVPENDVQNQHNRGQLPKKYRLQEEL
jgi:polyferredoxin